MNKDTISMPQHIVGGTMQAGRTNKGARGMEALQICPPQGSQV